MGSQCGPSFEFSQGLCYPKCRDNYTGIGSICYQNCPTTGEFTSTGPLCQKVPIVRGAGTTPFVTPCPAGYIDNGRDCVNPQICAWPNQCSGTNMPSLEYRERLVCANPATELSNGLCYPKCPSGFTGVNQKCYPACPTGFIDLQPPQGLQCVKPQYGRGPGSPPLNGPLQTIRNSPNGSTLLQRLQAGTTPQNLGAASRKQNGLLGSSPSVSPSEKDLWTSNVLGPLNTGLNSTFGFSCNQGDWQCMIGVAIAAFVIIGIILWFLHSIVGQLGASAAKAVDEAGVVLGSVATATGKVGEKVISASIQDVATLGRETARVPGVLARGVLEGASEATMGGQDLRAAILRDKYSLQELQDILASFRKNGPV